MPQLRLRFPDKGGGARQAGAALIFLGIMVLSGVLYELNTAVNEVAYLNSRIASVDRRMQRSSAPQGRPLGPSGYVSREAKQEIAKANAVMSEIDLPWEALFDSIEYASSHDVALLSFQPDPAGRTMRIGGEAKNIAAMLDFVGALEREPVLKDAHLLKYQVKQEDPYRPVIFSLTASWT